MTALVELMDRELQADCGVPLAFYDVMIEVYRSPGHSIRMSDLAERVLLSRSWITRRVGQLEAAGLLARCGATDDRRPGARAPGRRQLLNVRAFAEAPPPAR